MTNQSKATSVADLLDLSGKNALVTGASGNIGSTTALRLAEAGASVIAHYNANKNAAETLAQTIRDGGGTCLTVQANLCEESAVIGLFDALNEQGLAPDIVVNNAARHPVQSFEEMSLADWQSVMSANLDSVFAVLREAAKFMRKKGEGAIVNIASIEGIDPAIGNAHYATSKAGLLMLARVAANQFGSSGIRINSISPGLIRRDNIENEWPEGVERWQANAPLGCLGETSDIADAVLFLASPAARWITGVNLVVDGGMSSTGKW